MALVSLAGPLLEPVLLSDIKIHLRVSDNDEDTLITSLIAAARVHVEHLLSRKMITQSWSLYLDVWPENDTIILPLNPVQSISDIRLYDAQDNVSVVNPADYYVDVSGDPARIIWLGSGARPRGGRIANGIEVRFNCGYGDNPGDVPEPLRQAITLLVTHWYERREPVEVGEQMLPVPMMIASLLSPYRSMRIGV